MFSTHLITISSSVVYTWPRVLLATATPSLSLSKYPTAMVHNATACRTLRVAFCTALPPTVPSFYRTFFRLFTVLFLNSVPNHTTPHLYNTYILIYGSLFFIFCFWVQKMRDLLINFATHTGGSSSFNFGFAGYSTPYYYK